MNIKEQKYIDIAKKLLQQEENNSYTVISNSMNPLIKKDDKIVCEKYEFESLKKYQIIAFKNGTSGNKNIPTVHRIIKKLNRNGEILYKTKGDNSLYVDKEFVNKEQFIGIVKQIVKNNKTIDLNTKIGKSLSMVAYSLFYIKNIVKLIFKNIYKAIQSAFKKESKSIYNDDLLVLRQSLLTKTEDWQTIVKNDVNLISSFIDNSKKICDLSFGGGYCEESFTFIRKGIEIEYKNWDNTDKNDFDVIICSRVINIVENKEKREKIYNALKFFIKQNGIILLSYINEENNFFIKLKRKIYKLILSKYEGPLSDDIIYEDKYFVMKNLPFKTIYDEIIENNFEIKKYKKSGNIISFVVSKK